MRTALVPIRGAPSDLRMTRAILPRFLRDSSMQVHLLNVQPALPARIARHTARAARDDWRAERAGIAMEPVRRALDGHAVPYSVHVAVGDPADAIAQAAGQLRCSEILWVAQPRHALLRWLDDAVLDRLLERTSVPVVLVARDSVPAWEAVGVPAALAAAVAAALAMSPH